MMMEILPEPTSNKLCSRRSDTYDGNPVKEILPNLNLHDHKSVLTELEVHVRMEMEIPRSSRVKFITACSYSIDKYKDMMKAQMKQSKEDNLIAFKTKEKYEHVGPEVTKFTRQQVSR
ncbi:hypothetical protein Tco_1506230 [Tanacetum coccineum]